VPKIIVIVLAILCVTAFCFAGNGPVAPTPPMGWNSWDSYGTSVTEAQVKANADVMARDLAKYGWQYIVVDIQWYEPTAQGHDYKPGAALTMDEYGRLTPAVNRFPSAANGVGFKALAD
jgi:alpha-galactosidase